MIFGYKCFDEGLVSQYGDQYEVGVEYRSRNVKFHKSGFHMCARLEDTLRYFDTTKEFDICEVVGFGNIHQINDEYNGFKPGDFILDGEKIGTHNGIANYTIGQRKGLGISYKEP